MSSAQWKFTEHLLDTEKYVFQVCHKMKENDYKIKMINIFINDIFMYT